METTRKYPFTLYFWMVPNPTTGRMRKTRYRMTEADAAQYPGAVRVDDDSLTITRPNEILPSPFQY